MKKLLSTVLALVIGLGCMATLAACSNKDAETAKTAVSTIKSMYIEKDKEVNADYTVIGQVKVDDSFHTITWTSDSANAVVGEMNETTKMVTIGITLADEVVNYKLTATVKVGNASDSVTFERKILAKAKDAAGTIDDPFSVAKVLEIGAKLATSGADSYYKGNGTAPLQVYVEGYVVDPGTQFAAGRAANVYIVDEYSDDKDKNSTGALQVYSLSYDDTYVKQLGDIAKGDKLKLYSFIQNYNGTIELTYLKAADNPNGGDVTSVCVGKTDARTDAQKIEDALKKVAAEITVTKAGPYTLPTATVSDVNYVWSTEDTTYTIDTTGKILNVEALPTGQNATLQATVSATCGSVTTPVTKDVTITIQKAAELAEGEVLLDLAFNTIGDKDANDKAWGGYGDYEVSFAATGASVDGTIWFSRASKQGSDQQITNVPVLAANATATGNNHAPTVYVTVTLDSGTIESAEFSLVQWGTKTFTDIHIEYFNGTSWVKCSDNITDPAKLATTTIPEGVTYVRLSVSTTQTSNVQVGLSSIKLVTDPDGEGKFEAPKGDEEGDNSKPEPPAPTGTFTAITTPAAGTYVCAMDINGTMYYLTGEMGTGNQSNYAASTTDASQAATIELVADGDGWHIKANGKYVEIVSSVNGTKTYNNIKFNDTRATEIHWVWNDEHKVFTWTNDNGTFWIGTYNTYTTFSASSINYITNANQYPAKLGTYSAN